MHKYNNNTTRQMKGSGLYGDQFGISFFWLHHDQYGTEGVLHKNFMLIKLEKKKQIHKTATQFSWQREDYGISMFSVYKGQI